MRTNPVWLGSVSQEGFFRNVHSDYLPPQMVHIYLIDLRAVSSGTFITDIEGRRYRAPPNFPTRFHPSDMIEFGSDKKVIISSKGDEVSSKDFREG
ncbi:hypothetical protein NC652_018843 [Populus alba x Populus x berolinensis]|nr:hypothetical protein NC652_018843 [Populus alba x Populus x berolinensis]